MSSRGESEQQAAVAKRRIAELERRKQRLVHAYVYDQALDRPTYDRELVTLDEPLTCAHLELGTAQKEDLDLAATLSYARPLLSSTSNLWQAVPTPAKRTLQPLVFPEGVTFDGRALGTPATACIFNMLGQNQAGRVSLVAPGEAASNTPLQLRPSAFTRLEKFLRRLDAFRRQEVIPQL